MNGLEWFHGVQVSGKTTQKTTQTIITKMEQVQNLLQTRKECVHCAAAIRAVSYRPATVPCNGQGPIAMATNVHAKSHEDQLHTDKALGYFSKLIRKGMTTTFVVPMD